MRRLIVLRHPVALVCLGAVIAGVGLWAGLMAAGSGSPGPPSSAVGLAQNRPVPAPVLNLPLEDQRGGAATLSQFRGQVVLLVPFLSSCQEECPITSGALLAVQRSIDRDGLSGSVAIVEASVDPQRDKPGRLAAYAHLADGGWPLLTGSADDMAKLWSFFGIYHQQVPEASPPGIDWQTNRPYAYDVNHSTGFIVLDSRLHERFFAGGMAKVGALQPQLDRLLDGQGQENLTDPEPGSWTISDALHAIGWVLGRPVPQNG